MVETQTPEWFETFSETERRECAANLTDAYFAALNTGEWTEFHSQVQGWLKQAEQRDLVTV